MDDPQITTAVRMDPFDQLDDSTMGIIGEQVLRIGGYYSLASLTRTNQRWRQITLPLFPSPEILDSVADTLRLGLRTRSNELVRDALSRNGIQFIPAIAAEFMMPELLRVGIMEVDNSSTIHDRYGTMEMVIAGAAKAGNLRWLDYVLGRFCLQSDRFYEDDPLLEDDGSDIFYDNRLLLHAITCIYRFHPGADDEKRAFVFHLEDEHEHLSEAIASRWPDGIVVDPLPEFRISRIKYCCKGLSEFMEAVSQGSRLRCRRILEKGSPCVLRKAQEIYESIGGVKHTVRRLTHHPRSISPSIWDILAEYSRSEEKVRSSIPRNYYGIHLLRILNVIALPSSAELGENSRATIREIHRLFPHSSNEKCTVIRGCSYGKGNRMAYAWMNHVLDALRESADPTEELLDNLQYMQLWETFFEQWKG